MAITFPAFTQPQGIVKNLSYNSICDKVNKGTYIFAFSSLFGGLAASIYRQFKFFVMPFHKFEQACNKNTDKRFSTWVSEVIHSHSNSLVIPTICASNVDPCLHTFVVPASVDKNYIKHIMFLPLEFQDAVLSHLAENHTCTPECKGMLQQITAIIDHEYAHAKHNHSLKQVVCIGCASAGFKVLFSRVHSWIKSKSGLLHALTPFIAYLVNVALIKKYVQIQEQQADENIHNTCATLAGGKQFFESLNVVLARIGEQNPHIKCIIDMERGNGNFLSFWSSHPPLNQRIARLHERIDQLKQAEETIASHLNFDNLSRLSL